MPNTTRTLKRNYREKGTGREEDVGANGFATDEEQYAEKARKQLYAEKARKQLGYKENAARFRAG